MCVHLHYVTSWSQVRGSVCVLMCVCVCIHAYVYMCEYACVYTCTMSLPGVKSEAAKAENTVAVVFSAASLVRA